MVNLDSPIDVTKVGSSFEVEMDVYSGQFRHRKWGEVTWLEGQPKDEFANEHAIPNGDTK